MLNVSRSYANDTAARQLATSRSMDLPADLTGQP
jgi:hypothetical protein